jgi:trehalose synthase
MTPLLKEVGVDARWDVMGGDERFFETTKKIHNALHGVTVDITDEELDHFLHINEDSAKKMDLSGDIMYIHDPQPAAFIEKKKRRRKNAQKWVWRCHIDFSEPDKRVWTFLKQFIRRYDVSIFSAPAFARKLAKRQVLIPPSIDPLGEKNNELSEAYINTVFERHGIDRTRPVITQISRFDYLKDPLGVIEAYRGVKKNTDCQLVLAGGGATDDPEGAKVLEEVKNEAAKDKDILVLFLPPESNSEINALQRGSTIVLQKSLREGFGLTVSEALWKAKPVIASAVGGIPLQISHKYSGILTHTVEGTTYWIKQLLSEPEFAEQLGKNGREHIKNHFLITRHITDVLLLFLSLYQEGDPVYLQYPYSTTPAYYP